MALLAHRRLMFAAIAIAAVLSSAVFRPNGMDALAQDATSSADEAQRTEAGVIATDVHWSLAEMTGDTAWLDQMLLPGYRSVNNDGSVHTKEAIVAGAAKRKGTELATAQLKFAAYQKEHPYSTAVTIHDNTAVISFYDPTLGPEKGIKSSDVLIYAEGHWHAMYSQHTAVKG